MVLASAARVDELGESSGEGGDIGAFGGRLARRSRGIGDRPSFVPHAAANCAIGFGRILGSLPPRGRSPISDLGFQIL